MPVTDVRLSDPAIEPNCRTLAERGVGRIVCQFGCACILTIGVGCSESGPELAPVTGRVFLDGVAVVDAGVLFAPTSQGPAASGSTSADGSFRLRTGSEDGALVGSHRVVISKAETRGISADADGLSGAISDGGWQFIEYLPARYSRPDTSGLTAEVVANSNNEFKTCMTSRRTPTSKKSRAPPDRSPICQFPSTSVPPIRSQPPPRRRRPARLAAQVVLTISATSRRRTAQIRVVLHSKDLTTILGRQDLPAYVN